MLIGSQKHGDLRNVVRLPKTSERRLRDHLLCKVAAYDAMRLPPAPFRGTGIGLSLHASDVTRTSVGKIVGWEIRACMMLP